MLKKMFTDKRGAMAISQILVMLIGIIAIGWAIGSEFKEVGARVFDKIDLENAPAGETVLDELFGVKYVSKGGGAWDRYDTSNGVLMNTWGAEKIRYQYSLPLPATPVLSPPFTPSPPATPVPVIRPPGTRDAAAPPLADRMDGVAPAIPEAPTPTNSGTIKNPYTLEGKSSATPQADFITTKDLSFEKVDPVTGTKESITLPKGSTIKPDGTYYDSATKEYSKISGFNGRSGEMGGDLNSLSSKEIFWEKNGEVYVDVGKSGWNYDTSYSPSGFNSRDGVTQIGGEDSTVYKFNEYGEGMEAKSISETGSTPKWGEPGGFGGAGTFSGALWSGVKWAGAVGAVLGLISMFVGDSPVMDALLPSATVGAFVGGTLSDAWGKGGIWETNDWMGTGWSGQTGGIVTGVAVTAILFVMLYKTTSQEIVTFTCYPWDAPSGGNDCKKCNDQGILPCSEYQCRSLGQSCQLLNPGTGQESCEWVNRHDVEPPIIEALESALSVGYKYFPAKAVFPGDRGVYIKNTASTTGCVKAFTPLTFGIWTHDNKNVGEPSICKIDYTRKNSFENMTFFFGGSPLFRMNHTQLMSLPGPTAMREANLTIQNGGNYSLYVRCQDANGNSNEGTFVFKFCVEEGPDTTPPIIVTTNLLNGLPVAFNQSSIGLEVYTNEPADCKWSRLDQTYDKMEESMSCSQSVLEMNAQMLYKCKTTLNGIKNMQENKYYFRCQDKPGQTDRNKMEQSYEFTVVGTQPLIVDSVKPSGTIKDATDSVKVTLEAKTSAGYKGGEAFCYFSDTGDEDSYVKFLNTGTWESTQDLYLPEGDYTYYIKCVDLGGNFDSDEVNFFVDSDTEDPEVIRAYHVESYLKVITNEKGNCVYDNTDCSYPFADGRTMNSVNDLEHFVDWDIKKNFYIKCEDEYGNKPAGNICSFIARPFEINAA